MPETKLQVLNLRPGCNREGTSYSGEGGYYACDKARFRSGLPEKIGGWVRYGVGTFLGICKYMTEWVSLTNFYLLGLGTNLKFYILVGGTYFDITPIRRELTLDTDPLASMFSTLSANISATDAIIPIADVATGNFDLLLPFVVRIGSEDIFVNGVDLGADTLGKTGYPCVRGFNGTTAAAHSSGDDVSSSWMLVYDPYNGASAGDYVTISGATAFDGFTANEINQEFAIAQVSQDYFAVDLGNQSDAAVTGGGANVVVAYQLPVGLSYTQSLLGWGAGPWNGDHGWNTPYNGAGISEEIRLWSASNYGQDLFFNPRNGGIYFWSAATGLTTNGQVVERGKNITSAAVASVPATEIVNGDYYMISYVGTTDFTLIGAVSNTVGLGFVADLTSGSATGTGLVWDPATPSVAVGVTTTDERHVVAFGCNDAVTAALNPVSAGSFVTGTTYIISAVGTTDFTLIGAAENAVGITFVAAGAGSGTGKALEIIQDPMFVAWCGQEAPKEWYPTVTNTAGSYRLTYGSKIVTYERTRQEILVWTDTALYSMQYIGAPYIYTFNPISVDITIVSQNAMTTATGVTYWMGQDKFYAYSGRVDTLPCALRQYVFDDINTDQWEQVFCGTNEKYNEVWWFYPSAGSIYNDRYVIYNYLEKLWYYGQLSRSSWLDSHIIGNPLGTVGNLTVQHEVGTDDGTTNPPSAIAAYIESADFDLGDGGYQFSFVKRIIPDVDFIGSSNANPSATMTLKARNYPGQGVAGLSTMQNTAAPISGAEVSTQVYNYTQDVWVRIRGRQLVFRIESDALGVKWQLGSPRLQIQSDGRR